MVFSLFRVVYTLRVSFLPQPTVVLSMVHHIRAEGNDFVSTKNTTSGNRGQMFGFIAGLEGLDIGQLLTNRVNRWQDIPQDHLKTSTGMTPKLFVAALLFQYSFIVCEDVIRAGFKLRRCDNELNDVVPNITNVSLASSDDMTNRIRLLNQTLIDMNLNLTGTRSSPKVRMSWLKISQHLRNILMTDRMDRESQSR